MLDELGSRLKAAFRGTSGTRDPGALDPAVLGLIERVRDEWHRQNRRAQLPTRFGLRDVLERSDSAVEKSTYASAALDGMVPDALETLRWTDAAGNEGPVDAEFLARTAYAIGSLTSFNDATFVDVAFRCLLKRPADPHGLTNYVQRLRSGQLDRIDVLRGLSGSAEGRSRGVAVEGLPWLAFWRRARRVPVIGPGIVWGHALFRLPRLFREQRQLEGQTRALLAQHRESVDLLIEQRIAAPLATVATTERLVGELVDAWYRLDAETTARGAAATSLQAQQAWLLGQIHRLTAEVNDRATLTVVKALTERGVQQHEEVSAEMTRLASMAEDRAAILSTTVRSLEEIRQHTALLSDDIRLVAADVGIRATVTSVDTLRASHDRLAARVDALTREVADRPTAQALATDATRTSERLNAIEAFETEQAGRLAQLMTTIAPVAEDHDRETLTPDESRGLERFYEGLEARFRGARADIIVRFEPYLAFLREAGVGTAEAPIIDLGCGRGEWLELLRLNLLHAYGLDSSTVMVEHCRSHGLVAECADVLTYLRATRSESFGAVSAIHIVEHLSFKTLVLLIREIHRVLKPGGILLFETPNPENLFVAAYAFRMDPTHRVPLPPPMLEYLVESQGFEKPTVLRMNEGAYGNPFAEIDAGSAQSGAEEKVTTVLKSVVQQHLYCAPDYAVIACKAVSSSLAESGAVP